MDSIAHSNGLEKWLCACPPFNSITVTLLVYALCYLPFLSSVGADQVQPNNSSNFVSNNMSAAGPVIVAATSKHTATLIFLHGLGDTGHGWATAMAQVRSPHIKIICPTASSMPVTLNSGLHMPSWFDLKTLDAGGPEDEVGIKRAASLVHSMILKEEKEGIPSDRVLLGGFSQGGALAIYSALTYGKQLAGVAALSCWLPLHKTFPAAAISNKETPLLQCHGDCDPIVPYKWGQMTASLLKQFLKHTEFKTYRGLMHSSNDEEMDDLKTFVEKTIPSI